MFKGIPSIIKEKPTCEKMIETAVNNMRTYGTQNSLGKIGDNCTFLEEIFFRGNPIKCAVS